jgi:FkbM family methyltransferase
MMKKYIKKILKVTTNNTDVVSEVPSWKDLLLFSDSPFIKSEAERAVMTIQCHDTDDIEKVKDAGKLVHVGKDKVQIMHNGLKVLAGGYYGEWMVDIIKKLRGHHEPQEEFAFHEVLKQIDSTKPSYMIELGSFWSYYSLWFAKQNKRNNNICCEPDPNNIKIGKRNVELNKLKNFTFVQSAAGSQDGQPISFEMDSDRSKTIEVPVRSVDSLMEEYKWPKLDLLHMDVQGYETDSLQGAVQTIKEGKLRFLFVSTHHYVFSGDPLTHNKCIEFIKSNGGHIIAQHSVLESFSGDGLIVASFDKEDRDLEIHMSINSSQDSLFRPYEVDLSRMIEAYEKLRTKS